MQLHETLLPRATDRPTGVGWRHLTDGPFLPRSLLSPARFSSLLSLLYILPDLLFPLQSRNRRGGGPPLAYPLSPLVGEAIPGWKDGRRNCHVQKKVHYFPLLCYCCQAGRGRTLEGGERERERKSHDLTLATQPATGLCLLRGGGGLSNPPRCLPPSPPPFSQADRWALEKQQKSPSFSPSLFHRCFRLSRCHCDDSPI